MKSNPNTVLGRRYSGGTIIQLGILLYWTLFWLLNSVDKIIGGKTLLWVGRDRFAQFAKFFASIGLTNPSVPTSALVFSTIVEIVAFVFCLGALIHFLHGHKAKSRVWFFWGMFSSLLLFSFFSIGDQLFGDRFELLEHTLFWISTIASWGAFVWFNKRESAHINIPWKDWKKEIRITALVIAALVIVSTASIVKYSNEEFASRTSSLETTDVGNGVYKLNFPFLGGRTVFEKSINDFVREHPTKRIKHIYTMPNELRLKKADSLIVYIFTEERK